MLALGCDHGGYPLMKTVKEYLDRNHIAYKDFGTDSEESVDYPVYAKKGARAILSGECDKGILVCGTGIGITIAANRFPGIRAANCTDEYMARFARLHNDANILGLGARVLGPGAAEGIVETFLNTEFSGVDRHQRRIHMIEEDVDR